MDVLRVGGVCERGAVQKQNPGQLVPGVFSGIGVLINSLQLAQSVKSGPAPVPKPRGSPWAAAAPARRRSVKSAGQKETSGNRGTSPQFAESGSVDHCSTPHDQGRLRFARPVVCLGLFFRLALALLERGIGCFRCGLARGFPLIIWTFNEQNTNAYG